MSEDYDDDDNYDDDDDDYGSSDFDAESPVAMTATSIKAVGSDRAPQNNPSKSPSSFAPVRSRSSSPSSVTNGNNIRSSSSRRGSPSFAASRSTSRSISPATLMRLREPTQDALDVAAVIRPKGPTVPYHEHVIQFHREETRRHLEELVSRHDSWNAFEESHLKSQPQDDDNTAAYDTRTGAGIIVNASEPGENLWKYAGVQARDPKFLASSTVDAEAARALEPLVFTANEKNCQHLLGVYQPCQGEDGPVRHNGQPLYRLDTDGDLSYTLQR